MLYSYFQTFMYLSNGFFLINVHFALSLSTVSACVQSSHAREFHPCVLTEPYVKVSLHTALHDNKSRKINHFFSE